MSNLDSEEGAVSTSTATDEQREEAPTTSEAQKEVVGEADQPESGCGEGASEDGGAGGEHDGSELPDSTVSRQDEQSPKEQNDVNTTEESKAVSTESDKPSPLQEKIIRQVEVSPSSVLSVTCILTYTMIDTHSFILEIGISPKTSSSSKQPNRAVMAVS